MTEPTTTTAAEQWVFDLPSLGADMDRGTVLEWYVQPGDTVQRGDLVALVSTEKADIDIEIWRRGVVTRHLVAIGEEVPVGTPLLALDPATEAADTTTTGPRPPSAPPAGAGSPPAAVPPPRTSAAVPVPERPPGGPSPVGGADGVPASPRARVLAAERGVDLHAVAGTGPDGAVLARDVEQASVGRAGAEASPPPREGPSPPPREEIQPSGATAGDGDRAAAMRRAIADRMATANRTIPHYHLETDVDLTAARRWLERHNADLPVRHRVLPAALFVKAVGVAAAAVPELNGFWVDDGFVPATTIDVAVAISLRGGGLVTPAVRSVDTMTVDEIMAELQALVSGARRGALRSSWMVDVGITVTNLGDQGVDRVTGIIFPPQVALVGFGRVRDRPWAVDGRVEIRPVVSVTLAADHRATDGATGSRFLNILAATLEQPEEP